MNSKLNEELNSLNIFTELGSHHLTAVLRVTTGGRSAATLTHPRRFLQEKNTRAHTHFVF